MNKKITFATIIVLSLILSACSLTPAKKSTEIQTDDSTPQQTAQPTPSPQPAVSQSTELDDLEQELNDTLILEEDFSDL